jgi:hypothetical protein
MVIIIVPELEFDEVELGEAAASIGGGLSPLAGSVDPCEKAPAKNRNTATTQAKHRNLTTRLNVPSNHPGHDALNRPHLFS